MNPDQLDYRPDSSGNRAATIIPDKSGAGTVPTLQTDFADTDRTIDRETRGIVPDVFARLSRLAKQLKHGRSLTPRCELVQIPRAKSI